MTYVCFGSFVFVAYCLMLVFLFLGVRRWAERVSQGKE